MKTRNSKRIIFLFLILLISISTSPSWASPNHSQRQGIQKQIANLVAHWRMDEDAGLTVLDSSGHSRHGTIINGAIRTEGKSGNALEFDGVDDYVDLGTLPGGAAFTMEAWIKTSSSVGWRYIVGNHPFANGSFLAVNASDSLVRFSLNLGGEKYVDTVGINPVDGEWHHIVGVYNGSTAEIYFDCALNSTRSGLSGVQPSFTAALGKELFGGGNQFDGGIDEVVIYDRALSAEEITQHCSDNGSITIINDTIPENATGFQFGGDLGSFTLSDGDSYSASDKAADTYHVSVSKASLPDEYWGLLSVQCEIQNGASFQPPIIDTDIEFGVDIPVESDQNVTCTFFHERVNFSGETTSFIYLPIILAGPN